MPEKDTEAIGGILSSILANPKLMETLSSLMRPSATDAAEEAAPVEEAAPAGDAEEARAASAAPSLDIASMLSSISPEAIAALPNVVSMLSPLFGGAATETSASPKEKEKETPTEATAVLVPRKHLGHSSGEHVHLLLALKPYVSHGRREMIDNIIRLSRFADMIRKMGGNF